MPPTKIDGEKVGALAMARTSPFVQSRHTTEPPTASWPRFFASAMTCARASSAAFWIPESMVSTTSLPLCGLIVVEVSSTLPLEST